MKLSLVLPCYNEETNIRTTTDKLCQWFVHDRPEYVKSMEIVLIDDGSSDTTRQVMSGLSAEDAQIEYVVDGFSVNRGRGAALRQGFSRSTGEYVVALDADLAYDETHISDIMKAFLENSLLDIVVVSAYMRGGHSVGIPWRRLLVSRIANKILAGFLHQSLKTVTCVVRGYRGDFIRNIPLFSEGKDIHLEILRTSILRNARIVEIPGRNIWKKGKDQKRRKTNLKFINAAGSHLMYGFLVRPTRIFAVVASILLAISAWEGLMIASSAWRYWGASGSMTEKLWQGLAGAFAQSPHTFFIFGLTLIISFQFAMIAVLLAVIKFQHAENLRFLLNLWAERDAGSDKMKR